MAYSILKMKTFTLLVFLLLASVELLAQGGWDIEYMHADSISILHLGKEVRLDFKSPNNTMAPIVISIHTIRKLLSRSDTVQIELDDKLFSFVESWEISDDMGFLNDQMLQSIDDSNLVLRELFLEKISNNYLEFKSIIYHRTGLGSINNHLVKCREELIKVEKSVLRGMLIRYN